MKKQLFIAMLASALLITSVPMAAFAEAKQDVQVSQPVGIATATSTTGAALSTTGGAVSTTTPAITVDDSTTGAAIDTEAKAPDVLPTIKLSLDGAYKKMTADSPQSIIAKYNYDNELAVGKGYSENLSNLKKAEDANLFIDTSSKPVLQASRNFANAQAPRNYEATLNALKIQTYEMYYNYKYIEAQVQVAKDNLVRVQKVYDSTMLQFKVGKVSKLDTLTAQTNLNEAKDNYQKAVNGLEQMKMNFNLFMGYNIHQPLTLTDSLTALALPAKSLDASIKDALEKRNEIPEAKYAVEVSTLSYNNVKAYPRSSATYKKADLSVKMAEQGLKSAPGQVEIDVRTKYMDMKQKYDAVQSGKVAYENSKESSRLGQLQFENGFITVTDLSGINLATFNAEQAYFKSILDYNLAVHQYEFASGVGVKSSSIQTSSDQSKE